MVGCDTKHFENNDHRIELIEFLKDITKVIDILEKYSDDNHESINNIIKYYKLDPSVSDDSFMIPDEFIMDALDNFKVFRMAVLDASIDYNELLDKSLKDWKKYANSKKKDIEQLDFDSIDVNKLNAND